MRPSTHSIDRAACVAYAPLMGYEVEIKFRVPDHKDLVRRLGERGVTGGSVVPIEDAYLAHPGRDFAQTDEALRLRRDGPINRITYKGPKRGGPAKTREEIEIPYADGDETREGMTRLFERLGFRPVAVVRKKRQTYHLDYQERPIE